MPATAERYEYEVFTDDGRSYILELDEPVQEGETGRRVLQQLLHRQLQAEIDKAFDRRNFPVTTALKDIGRGIVGGARDIAQGIIDTPTGIFNSFSEFVSPDPPGGPPGSRRRLIPEVQGPQLPDLAPPQSGLEAWTRTGTAVGGGIALHALALPAARRGVFGPRRPPVPAAEAPPSVPRMWETPPAPPVAPKTLSEGAQRIARRVLDMPWTPDQLGKMTREQAYNAIKRLRREFPEHTAARDAARHLEDVTQREAAMHLLDWQKAQRRRRGIFSKPNTIPPLSKASDVPGGEVNPLGELLDLLEAILWRR